MNQYAWATLGSIVTMVIATLFQYVVTKRVGRSTDRHVNFEEANEIISRLNEEITRKDLRITELEKDRQFWQDKCRECELKFKVTK